MTVIDLYLKCLCYLDVVVIREISSSKESIINVRNSLIPAELRQREVHIFDIFENENYETVLMIEVYNS